MALSTFCYQRVQLLLVHRIIQVVEVYSVRWEGQVVLQRHPKLGAGGVNHEHPVGLHAKLVARLDSGQNINKPPLLKQQQ